MTGANLTSQMKRLLTSFVLAQAAFAAAAQAA